MFSDITKLIQIGIPEQEIYDILRELKVPPNNYKLCNEFKKMLSGNKKQLAILLNDFLRKYPNEYYNFALQNYSFLYDKFSETPLYPQGENLYDVAKYAMIGRFLSGHPDYEYDEISTRKLIGSNNSAVYCLKTLDGYGVKKNLGEIALKVLRFGTYYGYKIYKNVNALPLTYTYDTYVTESDVDGLNGVELQEIMMNAIVLTDSQVSQLSDSAKELSATSNEDSSEFFDEIGLSSESLDYTINCDSDDVSVQGNSFVVTKAGSSITINFTGKINSETYFVIDGMDYKNATTYELYFGNSKYDPLNLYTKEGWNELDYTEQSSIFSEWLFHKISSTNVELSLKASNGATKNMRYFTSGYNFCTAAAITCANE